MPENWQDLAKQFALWESQRGGNAELMLKRTDTNSRVNEDMARIQLAIKAMTDNWSGKYKAMYHDLFVNEQELYLTMDAFSRKQAIELAAAMARANAAMTPDQGESKPSGIMGLFKR